MPRRRPSWVSTVRRSLGDLVTFVRLSLTSRARLAAENLFLRKQLALYQERHTKPKRPDRATRVALVLLSRLLDWRSMLTVVQPDTLIGWHRQGWRLWYSAPAPPFGDDSLIYIRPDLDGIRPLRAPRTALMKAVWRGEAAVTADVVDQIHSWMRVPVTS